MTAKEYLQQIYTIRCKIKRLEASRQEIRADLYSIKSPAPDSVRVQTTVSGDKELKLIARVDEIERDLVSEIESLTEKKKAIIEEIEEVPVENYKQLLFDRYVLCQKWEKIACDYDKGIRWIYRMHGKALAAFEKVWDDH